MDVATMFQWKPTWLHGEWRRIRTNFAILEEINLNTSRNFELAVAQLEDICALYHNGEEETSFGQKLSHVVKWCTPGPRCGSLEINLIVLFAVIPHPPLHQFTQFLSLSLRRSLSLFLLVDIECSFRYALVWFAPPRHSIPKTKRNAEKKHAKQKTDYRVENC